MNIYPIEVMAAALVSGTPLCAGCGAHVHCLAALQGHAAVQPTHNRFKIRRGMHLYRPGDAVGNRIYAVYSGTLKIYVHGYTAEPTIVRFPGRGNLVGLDSVGAQYHAEGAIALEDSYVCEIPFQTESGACLQLHQELSREIAKEQQIGARLRHSGADQRMSSFLLKTGERLARLGYSATRYRLPMAKNDMANYLGLTPACVSRTLVRMQQTGLLALSGREVRLLDLDALHTLANLEVPAASGHPRPGVPAPILGRPGAPIARH